MRVQLIKTFAFLLVAAFLTGCVNHQELLNFSQGDFAAGDIPPPPPMVIQVDDLLSIRIVTLDEEASAPFNLDDGIANLAAAGNSRPIIGYLVDAEGNVELPVVGIVGAAGLTVNEFKEKLRARLGDYLESPTIVIRFINFRITLMGEVKSPGSYVMPNERVTLLDALGYAGDLTPYANRNNILIVREQNGERDFNRLDLQDRNIFASPYFYLRQNDYIYVEPLPEATASVRDQSQRILPWVGLVTSVVTLTLTLARTN